MSASWQEARRRMVRDQIEQRGVRDGRVLSAMEKVPRHLFVPDSELHRAYEDHPLPLPAGQTISQPYMVARMTELLAVTPGDRVLEVGCGSGYQAAVLAELGAVVFAVEIVHELAELAARNLATAGSAGVRVDRRDGTQGWPEHAPFAGILVSAGAPALPALLVGQLDEGGRLVIPIGARGDQVLRRIVRHGDLYESYDDTPCRFVDLVGKYGWGGAGAPSA